MAEDRAQQLNFTVVPDDDGTVPRVYSNFCAIQNSPFDFTLSFCEMLPLGEKQVKEAQATHFVKARMVVPAQMIPGLIAALQDNFRLYQESFGPPKGPVN